MSTDERRSSVAASKLQMKLKPKVTEFDDPGKKGQKGGPVYPYLSPYDLVKNTQHTYVYV